MTKELLKPILMSEEPLNGGKDAENPVKVIIPIYNEETTIIDLIKRIQDTFSKLNKEVEIICVDDGSIDNTRNILKNFDITLLCNEKNLGKGIALLKGFETCKPLDIIITLDGDGEHCPEDIPKLLEPILNRDADIVIGSRFLTDENGNGSYLDNEKYLSHMRKIGNRIFAIFGTVLTQKYITDTQCGFKAFRPNIIHNLNLEASGFEIETEMIIEALSKGYKIMEVPINNGAVQRDSYMNIFLDSLKIWLTFFRGVFPRKFRFIFKFLISKINKIT